MGKTTIEQTIVRWAWGWLITNTAYVHLAYAVSVLAGLFGFSVPVLLAFILLECATVACVKISPEPEPLNMPTMGAMLKIAMLRHFLVSVMVWPWIGLAWLVLP